MEVKMDVDAELSHTLGRPNVESSNLPEQAHDEVPDLKRKLDDMDRGASPMPNSIDNVILSPHPIKDTPRLAISRHPAFVPVPDTGDPPLCNTELTIMNRSLNELGYRYIPAGLAEPGSVLPYRTIESRPTSFRISWEDRSPFIRVTEDGLGIGGQGGFRSARCNVPVREGKWYMEVKILKGGGEGKGQSSAREGAHVRLGWGRREAPLNGPIGLDGYSYGIRDKSGEKFTLSRPKPYGKPFGTGDVVGMYISLPSRPKPDPDDLHHPARLKRERIAIVAKGQEYFEMLEYPQSKEMIALMRNTSKQATSKSLSANEVNVSPTKKSTVVKNLPGRNRKPKEQGPVLRPLPTLGPESLISFFINGECQGIAFQDLYDYLQLRQQPTEKEKVKRKDTQHVENHLDDGTLGYYPLISLYNDARIQMNPGPNFDFPPPNDIDSLLNPMTRGQNIVKEEADYKQPTWRPVSERYPEFMQDMWAQDDVDEELAKIAAKEAAVEEEAALAKAAVKELRKQHAAAKKKAKVGSPPPNQDVVPRVKTPSSDDRFGPEVNEFLESAAASPSSRQEDESSVRDASEEPIMGENAEARNSTPSSAVDLEDLLLGEGDFEDEAERFSVAEDDQVVDEGQFETSVTGTPFSEEGTSEQQTTVTLVPTE